VALHWLHVSVLLHKERIPLDCMTLKMTALLSVETSATVHQSVRQNNQTDLNLQQRRCETLTLTCFWTSEVWLECCQLHPSRLRGLYQNVVQQALRYINCYMFRHERCRPQGVIIYIYRQ
jgi:hypothetical protein